MNVNLAEPCRVFWCEPTGRVRRWLRCYQPHDPPENLKDVVGVTPPAPDERPACKTWCCDARVPLDEVAMEMDEEGRHRKNYQAEDFPDAAWPMVCETCGEQMVNPTRQIFCDDVLVVKTGERAGQEFPRRDLPVGAMWAAPYYGDIPDWCGRDGIPLMVVTPGGEWHVDGHANNCTLPDDKEHRCWVRSGDPRTGYVHVDKDSTVQRTCEAGAGSIWINKGGPRDWHGFLYHGYLINADGDQRHQVDVLRGVAAPAVKPLPRPGRPPITRPEAVRGRRHGVSPSVRRWLERRGQL